VKIPLGLWEGSTENATLARTLLADLVDRGLDPSQAILFVIDGGKALRRAIKDVFGEHALVHRCHRHKERNVCDLLPELEADLPRTQIRAAWALTDAELAEQRLELLASELDRTWPDAAASLREGMTETLTLTRLGITGQLARTLCSTNPCESMIEIVRYTQRNVKHWQDGDMRRRWTAAGMLVAEAQFRRIIGYKHLATLVIAIERHAILSPRRTSTTRRSPSPLPSDRQPIGIAAEIPRRSRTTSPPNPARPCRIRLHEAAKESNLPSGGLHRPAGFEGQMGHQTPAAPFAALSLVAARPPEDVAVAVTDCDAAPVEVVEERLGVLAARSERVAELRQRDLAALARERDRPLAQRLELSRGEVDLGVESDGASGLDQSAEAALDRPRLDPERLTDRGGRTGLVAIGIEDREDEAGDAV
jgi:Transposase, Mutator family